MQIFRERYSGFYSTENCSNHYLVDSSDAYSQREWWGLTLQSVDGSCSNNLDKNDLHRFGITDFKSKTSILKHIKKLTTQQILNNINDNNGDQTSHNE